MCGIIGFLGFSKGIIKVYEGLVILQNRGYDSAGISSICDNKFILNKYASKNGGNPLKLLESHLSNHEQSFNIIGHNRWGSTGSIYNDMNAHPHIDYTNKFSVVHNGIIENYAMLKEELIGEGVIFKSETDTEVIVNLIGYYYKKSGDVLQSIEKAIGRIEGTWGLAIQCVDEPDAIYCSRHGSPLLIGSTDEYIMIASEQSGFSSDIKNYVILDNSDIVKIKRGDNKINFDMFKNRVLYDTVYKKTLLSPDPYPHWTIKEINEQYDSSIRALGMGSRIKSDEDVRLGGLYHNLENLMKLDHLILLGCGTSYNAGLYSLNTFKKISYFNTVQIFDGSEFSEYDIPHTGKTGLILLSQSGETKDLHRCIKIANKYNLATIGVVNVVDSLIARDVDCGVYVNAGKEIGVASTKSFTSQALVLNLIACWFSQYRWVNKSMRSSIIKGLRLVPHYIRTVISQTEEKCIEVAKYLVDNESLFILGKGDNEAIALEGALKIKELGYMNANGCSTACLKHGPFALLCKDFPVIILLPDDKHFALNNFVSEEMMSRDAYVIGISDKDLNDSYKIKIKVPSCPHFFGIIANICLQLIAYHLAIMKGNNCDRPRNLCKSVTVH